MNRLFPKTIFFSTLISGAILTACHSSDNARVYTEQPEQAANSTVPVVAEEMVMTGSKVSQQSASVLGRELLDLSQASVSTLYRPRTERDQYYFDFESGENYAEIDDGGIIRVVENAVSTFSIDVDTGAYSNVRRFLNNGSLPPENAVRAEELINYFSYDYSSAESRTNAATTPFTFNTEISQSPWSPGKHLLHIGLQANELISGELPPSNLVFLVDVSGSMNSPDKLELLKTSLKLLSRQLTAEDSVAIVVYAGASGVVLEPTDGDNTRKITAALDRLHAGGGTNGAAGIQLAYSLAQDAFVEGGINRVILATDGDFNVGMANVDALKDLIAEKRESGINLTTLGFGSGNYNDEMMEQLADVGNGNYAYIDNINEARKVLVDELNSTLQIVAKDVKIQIEFNPAVVAEYRLVGYENRALQREDFNNDKVDAGEIGAGHTVTAIYEVSLVGSDAMSVDPLRYDSTPEAETYSASSELAYLKLRYKEPEGDESILLERAIMVADINVDIDSTSDNYRFSAAVAGFAQLLRGGANSYDYSSVLALGTSAKGEDEFGYRSEFINLVRTAQVLSLN